MSIVYWGLFYDDPAKDLVCDDDDDDEEEEEEKKEDDEDVQPSDRGLGAGRRNCIVI